MAKINEGRIMRRSREGTNQRNTQRLLNAIGTLKSAGAADLIHDNFNALEKFISQHMIKMEIMLEGDLKPTDLDLYNVLDILHGKKNAPAHSQALDVIRPILFDFVKQEGFQNIVAHNLGLKFEDADKVGARDLLKKQKAADYHADDIQKLKGGASTIAYAVASISVRTLSFAGGTLKDLGVGTKGIGDIMEGAGHLLLGRKTWKTIATAVIAGIGAFLVSPADLAAQYPTLLNSTAKNAFRDACLTHPEAMSNRLNAAYAIAMDPKGGDAVARYVYDGSWAAARHGVPPQIIAEFAEFESYSGKRARSKNSSASSSLQNIDQTKFLYSKAYGKDTFRYKESLHRIHNNKALPEDRTFVTSVDTVAAMTQEQIIHLARNQHLMDAPTLGAMRVVDDHAYASELFALHFKASVPKDLQAKIPTMSPKELHNLVSKMHYVKDHNLGVPNTNAIQKVINYNNQHGTELSLTDPAIATVVGPVWATKLREIVKGNPSLMNKGLSANYVFDRMGDKFSHRVMPITNPIQAVFERAGSITELCIDPAKADRIEDIPTHMPHYEAASRVLALKMGFNTLEQEKPVTAGVPAPGIPTPTPRPLN